MAEVEPPTGLKRPRSPPIASTYMLEVASFDGESQCIDVAAPKEDLGGTSGMTIAAWVRRARATATDCDRLIDFGNGQEQENIVINFKEGVSYESWGTDGHCHAIEARVHDAVKKSKKRKPLVHGTRTPPEAASASSASEGRSSTLFPKNAWTHVAVTHGGDGTATIFVNGKLCAKGPVALPSAVPRSNYYVGRSHWGHDPYFKGEMRDVLVFNYVLTRNELNRCALSRSFSSAGRSAPIMSVATSWREVPVALRSAHASSALAQWVGGFEHDAAAAPRASTLGRSSGAVDWAANGEAPGAGTAAAAADDEEAGGAPAVCARCLSPLPMRRAPSDAGMRRPMSTDHLFALGEADDEQEGGGAPGAAEAAPVACAALCGCVLGCGGGVGAGTAALQFVPALDAAQGALAVAQLRCCYSMHQEQVAALEALEAEGKGGREARQRLDAARDAFRRAQSVERMVRMEERGRLPTALQRDPASGQLVQPPRLAAALDATRGVFHAFAIYELRTGNHGGADGPWHVYVVDVVNMRQLLPQQECWQPNVASLLMAVLRRKAGAEQSIVTLKALNDSPELTSYYEEIGFSSRREAFATAGLEDTYRGGEMLLGDGEV